MSDHSGGRFKGDDLMKDLLALQKRFNTVEVIDTDVVNSLAAEVRRISAGAINAVKLGTNPREQTDAINMLRELIQCSLAIFSAANQGTVHTTVHAIKDFIQLLQATSTLCIDLQQGNSTDCLDKLNQCLIEGIVGLKKLTERSFAEADPELFCDMCDLIVKLCESESRNAMKQHVGLVRIYTQLLSSINQLPSLIKSSRADSMCKHLVRHLTDTLDASIQSGPVPAKAISFFVKKLIQIIDYTTSTVEDDARVDLAAKLRLLQVSDNLLGKELAGIDMWLLIGKRKICLDSNSALCLGRTIIVCDKLENDVELSSEHIEELLRLLLCTTHLIVKHMFLYLGDRNLFDHAVNAFCLGVSRLISFNLEADLVEAAIGGNFCKQLFSKEVLRLLFTMWPGTFSVYEEIFQEPGFLDITNLANHSRRDDDVRAVLNQCFAGTVARKADTSEYAKLVVSIYPCNSVSALLFSFISAKLAPHIDQLDIATLTAILNHYCAVLEENISNDCLVVSICIFFSYLPRKSFKDVVDTRLWSALKRVGEGVHKSGRKIGKLFGQAALFSFVRDVDDTRLVIHQPTDRHVTDELIELLQGRMQQEDQWTNVNCGLEVGPVSEIEPLQNEYFRPEKNSADTRKHLKEISTKIAVRPEPSKPCPVKELCRFVYEVEKKTSLSQEDRVLIEVCLDKLKDLLN